MKRAGEFYIAFRIVWWAWQDVRLQLYFNEYRIDFVFLLPANWEKGFKKFYIERFKNGDIIR